MMEIAVIIHMPNKVPFNLLKKVWLEGDPV